MPSDDCETPEGAAQALAGVDGVCVPGGFGVRGIEGKLGAIRHTRVNGIPTLGLCLGLQCMVIEYARDVAGLEKAQLHRVRPGDPGRRSSRPWPARSTWSPASATWAAPCGWAATRPRCRRARSPPAAYGATEITERHRHRYEVANAYRDRLTEAGLVFSGTSPDGHAGRVRRAAAATSTRSSSAPRRTRS